MKQTRRTISRRKLLIMTGVGLGAGLVAANWGLGYVLKALQSSRPIPSTPTIIPRTAWGARPPNHEAPNEYGFTTDAKEPEWYVYPENLADVYRTVVIHHSASRLFTDETMSDIQDLHMDRNGWADIGYHYGIDKDGVIYEGRDIHVRGASVAGHNTGTIGVVVMGDFQWDMPLDVQLEAAQTLVNWLAALYRLTHLAGHFEFNPESVCPGKNMVSYLDTFAQKADLQRGTGGYVAPE